MNLAREYANDRDSALNKGTLEALKAFCIKYSMHYPDDEVMEIAMHKMRLACKRVYPRLKKESKQWLKEHEYKETIGE